MSPTPAAATVTATAFTTGASYGMYSANDYQLAIELSKALEVQLVPKLGAQGKGLHEKTSSVQRKLPMTTVCALRYVASVRNRFIHDESVDGLPDRQRFIGSYESARNGL